MPSANASPSRFRAVEDEQRSPGRAPRAAPPGRDCLLGGHRRHRSSALNEPAAALTRMRSPRLHVSVSATDSWYEDRPRPGRSAAGSSNRAALPASQRPADAARWPCRPASRRSAQLSASVAKRSCRTPRRVAPDLGSRCTRTITMIVSAFHGVLAGDHGPAASSLRTPARSADAHRLHQDLLDVRSLASARGAAFRRRARIDLGARLRSTRVLPGSRSRTRAGRSSSRGRR